MKYPIFTEKNGEISEQNYRCPNGANQYSHNNSEPVADGFVFPSGRSIPEAKTSVFELPTDPIPMQDQERGQ
jgi:hypothetical protein